MVDITKLKSIKMTPNTTTKFKVLYEINNKTHHQCANYKQLRGSIFIASKYNDFNHQRMKIHTVVGITY